MKIQEVFQKFPIAISAGAAVVLFSILAIVRSGSADDRRDELKTREAQASRIADNIHNGQRLPAQLEQMESLIKQISERLSAPTDVAGNQQYFYKLESDSGVKLSELHQVAAPKRATKPKYTQYSTITYSVAVQGDFTHLVTFLKNLELGSKISAVTGAEIAAPAKVKDVDDPGPLATLQMNLTLQLLGTL